MDTKIKFRPLRADEIECRIASISKNGKGLTLLLYKNARCDMNILDECIGADNWQRRHYECKGNLFCSIGIRCGNDWIWKDDCGTESYTEKEKGEASDSFKRAGFNWGIGRELYTAPLIWIKAADCHIEDNNGRLVCYDHFRVKHVKIEDGKITELVIYNEKKRADCFSTGVSLQEVEQPETGNAVTQEQLSLLYASKDTERIRNALLYYKVDALEKLTFDQAAIILRKIKKAG